MKSDISAQDISKALKDTGDGKELIIDTVISAEPGFSGLRRLKTYLRSTIGQSQVSSLALM